MFCNQTTLLFSSLSKQMSKAESSRPGQGSGSPTFRQVGTTTTRELARLILRFHAIRRASRIHRCNIDQAKGIAIPLLGIYFCLPERPCALLNEPDIPPLHEASIHKLQSTEVPQDTPCTRGSDIDYLSNIHITRMFVFQFHGRYRGYCVTIQHAATA